MQKIIFILLLCILVFGCTKYALHRSKYFQPVTCDNCMSRYSVGKFENWDITVDFFAYYHDRTDPENKNNYFYISISASTFDKEAHAYKDTNYRANIKSLKILYGEELQNEIKIGKTKSTISDNGKEVSLNNYEDKLYVSPDIKLVTVVIEIEFLDKDNNSTVKKIVTSMKRKEESSMGPIWD